MVATKFSLNSHATVSISHPSTFMGQTDPTIQCLYGMWLAQTEGQGEG